MAGRPSTRTASRSRKSTPRTFSDKWDLTHLVKNPTRQLDALLAELEAKVAALTNNVGVAQEKAFAAWLQQPVDKKGKLPADLAPLADPAKTPTAKERNKLRQHYVAKVWPEESKQLPETKAFAAARDARDEIGRAHV